MKVVRFLSFFIVIILDTISCCNGLSSNFSDGLSGNFSDCSKQANYFIDLFSQTNGVDLTISRKGEKIFNHRFEQNPPCDIPDSNLGISFTKSEDNILCQINSEKENVFFSFLFDLNGTLELSSGEASDTGVITSRQSRELVGCEQSQRLPITFT